MRIGIIAEDLSDIEALSYILRKINSAIVIEKTPCHGGVIPKLDHRISGLAERFDDLKAIIVISDLDNKNCIEHLKIIKRKIPTEYANLTLVQIAIQEIEAWYLAMPDSIEAAFPSLKPFPVPNHLTDNIRDPKKELKQIFYKKLNRDYRISSDGPKIGKNFIYQAKRNYQNQSFNRFISKITNLQ